MTAMEAVLYVRYEPLLPVSSTDVGVLCGLFKMSLVGDTKFTCCLCTVLDGMTQLLFCFSCLRLFLEVITGNRLYIFDNAFHHVTGIMYVIEQRACTNTRENLRSRLHGHEG